MLYSSPTHGISNIYYLVVFIVIVGGIIYAYYKRKNAPVDSEDTSVLMSFYTYGAKLIPIEKGLIGDMHFSAFISNEQSKLSGIPDSFIYQVVLPFSTTIHLLGIPKKAGAIQLDPAKSGSIMEKVELEGDYNDYFELYCEKGMQEDVRVVLNPEAMLFTLNFCQSQNWEIVGNELYFVLASNMKVSDNNSTIASEVTEFINEIKPVIAKPLTDQDKALLTPYGDDFRNDLKCPACNSLLTNNDPYFYCKNGDGYLINGATLEKIKSDNLRLADLPTSTSSKLLPSSIVCPSCGNNMIKTNYEGGATIIYSCTNCIYRWLSNDQYNILIKGNAPKRTDSY